VVLLNRTPKYEVMLPQIVEMAEAGSGIDHERSASGLRSCGTRSICAARESGHRARSTDVASDA
jgi:hypothetical protein